MRAELLKLCARLCLFCFALCWCGCSQDATLDPGAAHLVLISQAGSSTIAVIDPSSAQLLRRVQVGSLPHRLVRDRSGRTVYAVLVGSQSVAELDTANFALRRTLLTAQVPEQRSDGTIIEAHHTEHAFDHTTCFDCHRAGGAEPIIVGERPVGIALSEDESRLYVSHIRSARLSVIDLASGELSYSEPMPPKAAAVEAADLVRLGESLVVALRPTQPSSEAGVVRFLDLNTLGVQAEFVTGSDPAALLALPERGSVLLSNFESNTVTELSLGHEPRTFTVTPGPLGAVPLRDGTSVLTLDYYSNAASLLDLDSGEVTPVALARGSHDFVNPTHAALDPSGRLAYVVSSGTDGHLLVLDLDTRELTGVLPIDGLSFDAVTVPR